MKRLACTFLLSLPALQLCPAVEAPAPETGANNDPLSSTRQEIVLKNKSVFAVDESGRSPFWPIGWKPSPASSSGAAEQTIDIPPSAFALTSTTVESGGRYAIINGKVMGEGQIFGLQIGNQIHQVSVKAIQDGQVILSQNGHDLPPVLLRRR